ncbi:MAG: RnfABCDGE type electron transport complex subunit G [Desulfobacterales bacterium]|uniref:Ion-translocating oxidoreductase complex subunit G n=1 Tax=Candidatus Desulfatibia profunda TaxID=2841695 RepID=A0A8J6TGE9_9BACT|nr:RnfABCDGE type electron transport complex subunit G [Candidatus Desulfatibia profunda]MBL7178723.1 RnfABCDGE type electron transport complex subunit G [Desulfobacterales bacterium]
MREMVKMFVVLTVLSAFSGGLLAGLRSSTAAQIENQKLEFVKGPAIKMILKGASNDPIKDRFKIMDGKTERSFFVGKFDGKASTVVFESFGKGFGGDIGLMMGVNIEDDAIIGIGVTTHSETPGLGSRAKDDPKFTVQFKGLSMTAPIKVTNDGGKVNALSGATITSRAVCAAATEAGQIYQKFKPQLAEKLKEFK